MKVTRRKLAATLIAGAAVLPAQTPAPRQPPAADDLTIARERMRASAAALANTKLPMATEPAFQFKA